MEQNRLVVVSQSLATLPSRRDVLRGLVAAGCARGLVARPSSAEGNKRRKKPKPPKPNVFGCLEVGDACKSAAQCCSGFCAGKKAKRSCRPHDAGSCLQGIPAVCEPENPTIAVCNNDRCVCVRTTAGSNFCANADYLNCAECKKDADCVALGFPSGTACIPWSEGQCAGQCKESGMACLYRCGYVPPDPEP